MTIFGDFIKNLNSNKVEYILIGGYSVILHGYPRSIGDIEIWVNRNENNYKKIKMTF